MKNPNKIMDVELPAPEAADLTVRAAIAGVPTSEYIGIQALAGAYGHQHPAVLAFSNRERPGISGPEIIESGD